MKITRFLLPISMICSLFMTACSHTVDITFFDDRTWKAESEIVYNGGILKVAGQYLPKVLEGIGLPFELPIDFGGVEDDAVEGGLETLVSYYGTKAIDIQYQRNSPQLASETSYLVSVSGRSYDQFIQLLPETITLTETIPGQYHLYILLGDANVFARALYQQDITLHAGKIISSNSPHQGKNTATWPNPREIDVVFTPVKRATVTVETALPWAIGGMILLAVGVGALVLILGLGSARRPKDRPRRPPSPHRR